LPVYGKDGKIPNPENGCELARLSGEPNELVVQIHPRMPVILPEQHHAAWLGETGDGNLKDLLVPILPTRCEMWEILRG